MQDAPQLNDLLAIMDRVAGPGLSEQLRFIAEIDKMKSIWRQTPLLDRSRKENDAEHSWQLSTMAMVLANHAGPGVDMFRVLQMLLIHDIVEIDAGDTPIFDTSEDAKTQNEREQKAADRLFGMLPQAQSTSFRALWDEFEARETEDSRFAKALDRLQPFLHNFLTAGASWQDFNANADIVRDRMAPIAAASSDLHNLVNALIDEAVQRGFLAPGES